MLINLSTLHISPSLDYLPLPLHYARMCRVRWVPDYISPSLDYLPLPLHYTLMCRVRWVPDYISPSHLAHRSRKYLTVLQFQVHCMLL